MKMLYDTSKFWNTMFSDQVGAVCQPHGAGERLPWSLPEAEADRDGDWQPNPQHGAGEDHWMDPAGVVPPQPLPGDTQLLWRHHRWENDTRLKTDPFNKCQGVETIGVLPLPSVACRTSSLPVLSHGCGGIQGLVHWPLELLHHPLHAGGRTRGTTGNTHTLIVC